LTCIISFLPKQINNARSRLELVLSGFVNRYKIVRGICLDSTIRFIAAIQIVYLVTIDNCLLPYSVVYLLTAIYVIPNSLFST